MKNIFYTILFTIGFIQCSIDDQSTYNEQPTDFNEDISEKTNFIMSTPIPLKVNSQNLIGDTLNFNVLDTLKFNIAFKAKYQDNTTDSYDLFKSTGALEYIFGMEENITQEGNLSEFIDLDLISEHPEAVGLSALEIKTSPILKDIFFTPGNIKLKYNSTGEHYESNFGIVLKNKIPASRLTQYLYIERITRNKPTDKNIIIGIPVLNNLGKLFIRVE